MAPDDGIEQAVRHRLRSLRTSLGLSLAELAAESGIGASTISRVETGKRTVSLDVLVPLARALGVDLDTLLDTRGEDADVVITPAPTRTDDMTMWVLSRPTATTVVVKARLEASGRRPGQQVHPGHDWFFVTSGRVGLALGDRLIVVEAGQAADFATMTPHAISALGGPAELIMLFDRDGQRVHRPRARREGAEPRPPAALPLPGGPAG